MKQAATIELFSYWDALRAGLDRVLLDAGPTQMRTLLANTFLVEVDARRAYPLRVVGGTLARLTAHARLGASFLECWDLESRDFLEAMLKVVHDERIPVVAGVRSGGEDKSRLAVECLLLPLASSAANKPRILGGMAPAQPINGRASYATLEIVSARPMRKSPHARLSPARPNESAPPFSPPTPSAREHFGRFRVIEGGRSETN